MLERILIAGSGGQGVLLVGKLLATVAVDTIPHVTFFPVYTIEVRGGTANCQVILSSDEITSPVSDRFDSILLMNQASVERFSSLCGDGCLTLINASLCKISAGIAAAQVDATETANQLGDTRMANLVMLGAYLARKPLLDAGAVEREIRQVFSDKSPELAELNVKAFKAGLAPGG